MGIILVLIYTYYYHNQQSADVFKYFDDGNIIHKSLRYNVFDYLRMITGIGGDAPHLMKYYDTCNFWLKEFNYGLLNDNRIVIRFNAIVRLISMGNIYIHTLFMSFISFTGLWGIFKVFEKQFAKSKWLLLAVVFFFPSVWFWTSGLLKEGILMGLFGLLFYYMNRVYIYGFKPKYLIFVFVLLFFLLQSKFYVLVAAIPGFIFVCTQNKFIQNKYLYFALVHASILLIVAFSKHIGYDFIYLIEQKQHDFVKFAGTLSEVGSLVKIPDLEPTIWSVIKNAPEAFFNTMFRPFLWESSGVVMLMAAFENILIVAAVVFAIIFRKKSISLSPYFFFSISFIICLFVIAGLTTPVLGALVRYKAPALPFMGIALLIIIDEGRVWKLVSKGGLKNN